MQHICQMTWGCLLRFLRFKTETGYCKATILEMPTVLKSLEDEFAFLHTISALYIYQMNIITLHTFYALVDWQRRTESSISKLGFLSLMDYLFIQVEVKE